MAEWITIKAAARASGYTASGLQLLLKAGKLPAEYIQRNGYQYRISIAAIPLLIEIKTRWHDAEVVQQPDNVIHVPDPLGIQEGLWLTPDEAQRLMTIRMYHRLYPTTQERNEVMRGNG